MSIIFIPNNYNGKTVYGDTDSSMIFFEHIKNNNDAVKLAEEITKEMEKHFRKPMKLEFEKIYEKYSQLSSLGFYNVYIYPGGLFEWLLLQDVYGVDDFPTTKKELDILRFKPNKVLNVPLLEY